MIMIVVGGRPSVAPHVFMHVYGHIFLQNARIVVSKEPVDLRENAYRACSDRLRCNLAGGVYSKIFGVA